MRILDLISNICLPQIDLWIQIPLIVVDLLKTPPVLFYSPLALLTILVEFFYLFAFHSPLFSFLRMEENGMRLLLLTLVILFYTLISSYFPNGKNLHLDQNTR